MRRPTEMWFDNTVKSHEEKKNTKLKMQTHLRHLAERGYIRVSEECHQKKKKLVIHR